MTSELVILELDGVLTPSVNYSKTLDISYVLILALLLATVVREQKNEQVN